MEPTAFGIEWLTLQGVAGGCDSTHLNISVVSASHMQEFAPLNTGPGHGPYNLSFIGKNS